MTESSNLERFVKAQDPIYHRVIGELRQGRKQTHWMWFIFPQIAGLGTSFMAQRFAIASIDEARAYLDHRKLGSRLRECTQAVLDVQDRSAHDMFGSPDDLKFRSSVTLFARIEPGPSLFRAAIDKYFESEPDAMTLERI